MKAHNIQIGDEYNEWTVIDGPIMEGSRRKWLCECTCGKRQMVNSSSLITGYSSRCKSCANSEMATNREAERRELYDIAVQQEFGISHEIYTKLRLAANSAVYRCTNPLNARYKDYGARGITVYQPWVDDRRLFIAHLATLPGHDDYELWLDREDNNKGYEPGNLRFVARSVSQCNRRPKEKIWNL